MDKEIIKNYYLKKFFGYSSIEFVLLETSHINAINNKFNELSELSQKRIPFIETKEYENLIERFIQIETKINNFVSLQELNNLKQEIKLIKSKQEETKTIIDYTASQDKLNLCLKWLQDQNATSDETSNISIKTFKQKIVEIMQVKGSMANKHYIKLKRDGLIQAKVMGKVTKLWLAQSNINL